jgi:hypothetical protein
LLSCPASATFSTRSPFVITRHLLFCLSVKVKRKPLPFLALKKINLPHAGQEGL